MKISAMIPTGKTLRDAIAAMTGQKQAVIDRCEDAAGFAGRNR